MKSETNSSEGKLYREDEVIEHKWKLGEFERRLGDRYFTREDECELCGCKRTLVQSWKNKHVFIFVGTYERSGCIFSDDNMPQCWGAKNPQ